MKLKLGERYVRRDGQVTNPLQSWSDPKYPYVDPATAFVYMENGLNSMAGTSECDLVSTYETFPAPEVPPQPSAINAGKAEIPTTTERAKSDVVGTGLVLIPWYSILAIGKIFIEGLRYGRDNWKKGIKDLQYQEERLEHAMLHLLKWKEGDRTEAHLAKVAWFCVTQLELERLENCHALMPEKQPNPDM